MAFMAHLVLGWSLADPRPILIRSSDFSIGLSRFMPDLKPRDNPVSTPLQASACAMPPHGATSAGH
jgi:hypothetical protein